MDLIEIARFEHELEERGDGLLAELLLPAELTYCRTMHRPAPHFAARFAAKEALLKALGTGRIGAISWHDIEVRRDAGGRPSLVLAGETAAVAAARGVRTVHLSLTHSEHYAGAVVALED